MLCRDVTILHMWINTLRPRQSGSHFADDIFKCIFLNENALISLKISLKFVPKALINNIPALVQIMAWRRPGAKPLSELMVVNLLTHICLTRPQCVKNAAYDVDLNEQWWYISHHSISYINLILLISPLIYQHIPLIYPTNQRLWVWWRVVSR